MTLFLKVTGFILLFTHGFWFLTTSMTDALEADGSKNNTLILLRKLLLITFASSGIWIGIVIWAVMAA